MNQALHLSGPDQAGIQIPGFEQNAPVRAANQLSDVFKLGVRTLQDFNDPV